MTESGAVRFLYGVGRPAFPFFIGGDGTIAHTLLTGLAGMGVDCRFVGTFGDHVVTKLGRLDDLAVPYALDGESLGYCIPYRVTLATDRTFAALVERTIVEFGPHVVFAQLNQAREILALAKRYGCRTALYVLDVHHEENFRALASEPDVIFSVSSFARGELRRRFGKELHVLYPLVDVDRYRAPRREEFVTMINPVQVKGVEVALKLAEGLPRQEFLFVEGWGTYLATVERIERLPNATYMRKQIDMRAVYGRTRVLIVPSQWQEVFGRVVVEAQAGGIPVIASRTGGLPEAVGRGGILIDDYRNPVCWLSALQGLLEDRSAYENLSEEAIENTRRFGLRRQWNPAHRDPKQHLFNRPIERQRGGLRRAGAAGSAGWPSLNARLSPESPVSRPRVLRQALPAVPARPPEASRSVFFRGRTECGLLRPHRVISSTNASRLTLPSSERGMASVK